MDPQAPTSFIPKKPLTGASSGPRFGLFFLIAFLFFIFSLAAGGAAFAYEGWLNKAIADKSESLKNARDAFQPSAIESLVRLDTRMTQAKSLLDRHLSPSAIFDLLSLSTLERVQFTSFEYGIIEDGTAEIALSGVADNFSSVALQSDQFAATKVLRDIIFSGLTVEATGKISFRVNATVDPSVLLYSRNPNAIAVPPANANGQGSETQ